MENIEKSIEKLKSVYGINLSNEYIKFLTKIDMFEYSWVNINVNGIEFELNHFLGHDEEPSRDLYKWYAFANEERKEYLTIAMGFGHEEIAIKVKGDNLGEIVLISPDNNEKVKIQKLCDDFKSFLEILKEEKGKNE